MQMWVVSSDGNRAVNANTLVIVRGSRNENGKHVHEWAVQTSADGGTRWWTVSYHDSEEEAKAVLEKMMMAIQVDCAVFTCRTRVR